MVEQASLSWERCASESVVVYELVRHDREVVVHMRDSCWRALHELDASHYRPARELAMRATTLGELDASSVERCDACAADESVLMCVRYDGLPVSAAVDHAMEILALLREASQSVPRLGDEPRWRHIATRLQMCALHHTRVDEPDGVFVDALRRADEINAAITALDHIGELELWARRARLWHQHSTGRSRGEAIGDDEARIATELRRWAQTRPSQFSPLPEWGRWYSAWEAQAMLLDDSGPALVGMRAPELGAERILRQAAPREPDSTGAAELDREVLHVMFFSDRWSIRFCDAATAAFVMELARASGWECVCRQGGSPLAAQTATEWIERGLDPEAALTNAVAAVAAQPSSRR